MLQLQLCNSANPFILMKMIVLLDQKLCDWFILHVKQCRSSLHSKLAAMWCLVLTSRPRELQNFQLQSLKGTCTYELYPEHNILLSRGGVWDHGAQLVYSGCGEHPPDIWQGGDKDRYQPHCKTQYWICLPVHCGEFLSHHWVWVRLDRNIREYVHNFSTGWMMLLTYWKVRFWTSWWWR